MTQFCYLSFLIAKVHTRKICIFLSVYTLLIKLSYFDAKYSTLDATNDWLKWSALFVIMIPIQHQAVLYIVIIAPVYLSNYRRTNLENAFQN